MFRYLSIINQDSDPQMESSKTRLKLFDGSLVTPLGVVNLQVIHGEQTQVVSGMNKVLLSAETWQKYPSGETGRFGRCRSDPR